MSLKRDRKSLSDASDFTSTSPISNNSMGRADSSESLASYLSDEEKTLEDILAEGPIDVNLRRSKSLNTSSTESSPISEKRSLSTDKSLNSPKERLNKKRSKIKDTWIAYVKDILGEKNASGFFETMSLKEQRFQSAIYEIYSTECNYIESIDLVIELFYAPLYTSESLMKKNDVQFIFGGLKEIVIKNKSFLRQIEDRRAGSPIIEKISDILIKAADDFQYYSQYCCHYDLAVEAIQKRMAKEKFANFIKEKEADPRMKKLNLKGFLILPVQRASRYPMLLKEVLKNCDETHPDYQGLAIAYQKMQDLALKVNADTGSTIKIQEIVNKLSIPDRARTQVYDLASPTRKFIKEGHFGLVTLAESTKVILFLFTDKILVAVDRTKEKKKPRFVSIWDNTKSQLFTIFKKELYESYNNVSHSPSNYADIDQLASSITNVSITIDGQSVSEDFVLLRKQDELYPINVGERKNEWIALFRGNGVNIIEGSCPKEIIDSNGDDIPTKKSIIRKISMRDESDTVSLWSMGKETESRMSKIEGVKIGPHEFVIYTYSSPAWCDACGQFIWGLKNQAFKCKFCYMDCHKNCLHQAPYMACADKRNPSPSTSKQSGTLKTLRRKQYEMKQDSSVSLFK